MDNLEMTILISGFTLSLSCFVDANWKCFKGLVNWISPAKLLGILRLTQGASTLTFLYSIATTMVCKILWIDPAMALVSSIIVTVAATALIGQLLSKKGAKLTAEETVDEKALRTRIIEDVQTIVGKAALTISENVEKRMTKAEANIQGYVESYYKRVNTLLERNEETLRYFGDKMNTINRVIEGYNEIARAYREEAVKREALTLQIEQVARLEEEYLRRLEALDHKEEVRGEKVTLTSADGIASRTKGNMAQKETADFLRNCGFQVEEYYGVGLPDYIIRWQGKRVAIGAHKAFTLSRQGTTQRTIKNELEAEIAAALKYKLPLVLLVTNLKNKRRWAELISYEKLKEFERFTTPVILADDVPETERICMESILRLKEILSHHATN